MRQGAGFQRISDRSELDGLIEKRQLYVAVPAATAWEGSAAGGGRCGEIAGCVATFPVGSTVGGVDATVLEFGLLCVAPEFVSKSGGFCVENEEFCTKYEEICIKNDEFCIKMMYFAETRGARHQAGLAC